MTLHQARLALPARPRAGGVAAVAGFIARGLICTSLVTWLTVSLPIRSAETTNEFQRLKTQCEGLILNQGKLDAARAIAGRMLALAMREHGEAHQETIEALHFVGFIAFKSGDWAATKQAWERSLAIQEQLPDRNPVWFSRVLSMLGDFYHTQHEFQRAETHLKRALVVREGALGAEHPEMAQIWENLGNAYWSSGDNAKAEAAFSRGISLAENGGRGYEYVNASLLTTLGAMRADLGNWEDAIPAITRALQMETHRVGPDSPNGIMDKLAYAHYRRGNLTEAETLHSRSLSIHTGAFGSNSFHLFTPLHGLGLVYLEQGQLEKAEKCFRRALALITMQQGEQELCRVMPLGKLSEVLERKGEYVTAQELMEQSLRLRERHLGPAHPTTCSDIDDLALLHFIQGRTNAALAAARRVQDGEERELADVLSFTSERQRLAYQNGGLLKSRTKLWATMGAAPALARAVIRSKGVVLDSLLEDRLLAERSDDAETRRLAEDLVRAKRRLATRHSESLRETSENAAAPRGMDDMPALREQMESLESALARKVTGLGRARRALSARVEDVQAAIPQDAALVEFLRYAHYQGKGQWLDSYGALLLTRHANPRWFPLGPAGEIDKNIKRYQHAVRDRAAIESLETTLRTLHRQVWQPIGQALPANTSRVILCPDGPLNFVSFATLLTASNRFLGEQMRVSYVSSSRDLLAEAKPPRATAELFVWANPDFGAVAAGMPRANEIHLASRAASVRGLRDLNFHSLPGAEREGRSLGVRATDLGFSQAVLRVGKDATEAALNRVRSPDVLHLATHGFVLPEMEPSRAASESRPDGENAAVWSKPVNPMLRCGLALAGARRTLDAWARGETVPADNDGIVTAEEIAALDLRRTRLAVLSACDTGLGVAHSGEGVLGLRRGFIQAGAQNLLLTLWPIDDDKTAGFMVDFHEAAHRDGDFPGALAEVQGRWLQSLREKHGAAEACRIAGPFILSFQGRPDAVPTAQCRD